MRARHTLPLVGLVAALCLAACAPARAAASADDRVNVVTTVGMLADMIQNVGGERVAVTSLMGAGVDPHYYKPTAGDIFRLDQADVIFYSGLDLEGRMAEVFEATARTGRPTFAATDGIDRALLHPVDDEPGVYDPHVWFDVTLWARATETVRDRLVEVDPTGADIYRANAAAYLTQLEALDAYAMAQIATIPPESRVLITAHDAFGYFGARYGLEVRGLQGTSTTAEAGAFDVRALADFIVARRIKAIFVESSVPQATIEAVRAACQDRGWDVAIGGELFSDAMGSAGTLEGTYIGMVRHNVDTIVAALR